MIDLRGICACSMCLRLGLAAMAHRSSAPAMIAAPPEPPDMTVEFRDMPLKALDL